MLFKFISEQPYKTICFKVENSVYFFSLYTIFLPACYTISQVAQFRFLESIIKNNFFGKDIMSRVYFVGGSSGLLHHTVKEDTGYSLGGCVCVSLCFIHLFNAF